jgi:hypothetical protein
MLSKVVNSSLALGIAAFFAIMWGSLLLEHAVVEPAVDSPYNWGSLLQPDEPEKSHRWDILFGQRTVGTSHFTIRREEGGLLAVRNETQITVDPALRYVLGLAGTVDITFAAQASPLTGLRMVQLVSDALDTNLLGRRAEGSIKLMGRVGEQRVDTELPYDVEAFVGDLLSPVAPLQKVSDNDLGRSVTLDVINPLAGRMEKVTMTVAQSAKLRIGAREATCYRLAFAAGSARWHSWVTSDGQMLVQGTPFGLTMKRHDIPPDALDDLGVAPAVPAGAAYVGAQANEEE